VLNLTNISDIKSNFLLGGVLLLEQYKNCILNHCSGYDPAIHALQVWYGPMNWVDTTIIAGWKAQSHNHI
jgi:hypothetical protein